MKEQAAAEASICVGGHVCSCLSCAFGGDPREGDIQTETCTDGRRPQSRYHITSIASKLGVPVSSHVHGDWRP